MTHARSPLTRLGPLALVLAGALLLVPRPASAHCDSVDGPVVVDAKAALSAGDPTPVLKWVGPGQEAEVRAAFQKTLAVRKLGADARDVADTAFFETLVRLHRETEKAPYTGLKAGGNLPMFIVKTESALASGSIDGFAKMVAEHAAAGIQERFRKASEAKKTAAKSVAEGRAYVAAYVDLMHYVEGVVGAVHSKGHSHEAAAPHVD